MAIRTKVLVAGVPSPQGRIYPREVLAEAVTKYVKERVAQGNAFGTDTISAKADLPIINSSKVTHLVTGVELDGDDLYVRFEYAKTIQGRNAKRLGLNQCHMHGTCQYTPGEVPEVSSLSIVQFALSANDPLR